jgi:hypothetical protein
VHRMGTGKSRVRSELEKNAMPGRFGELHTQPPPLNGRGPKASGLNPGE